MKIVVVLVLALIAMASAQGNRVRVVENSGSGGFNLPNPDPGFYRPVNNQQAQKPDISPAYVNTPYRPPYKPGGYDPYLRGGK